MLKLLLQVTISYLVLEINVMYIPRISSKILSSPLATMGSSSMRSMAIRPNNFEEPIWQCYVTLERVREKREKMN